MAVGTKKPVVMVETTGDYNADRRLSNLSDYPQALRALGAGVRPNLLDNPYFTGGSSQEVGLRLPINQRGQTSASEASTFYLIDRWKNIGNSQAEISDSGYTFTPPAGSNGWFQQVTDKNTEDFKGKPLTLSALFSDGSLITGTVGSWASVSTDITVQGYGRLRIQPLSNYTQLGATFYHDAGVVKTYVAAKLEEGRGQTLAYQDGDGVWQLLPQPDMDYAAQLEKCLRYLGVISAGKGGAYFPVGYGMAFSAASARIQLSMPVPPRDIAPTVSFSGQFQLTDGATSFDVTNITADTLNSLNLVSLNAQATGLAVGEMYQLRAKNDADAKIIISFEL